MNAKMRRFTTQLNHLQGWELWEEIDDSKIIIRIAISMIRKNRKGDLLVSNI